MNDCPLSVSPENESDSESSFINFNVALNVIGKKTTLFVRKKVVICLKTLNSIVNENENDIVQQ